MQYNTIAFDVAFRPTFWSEQIGSTELLWKEGYFLNVLKQRQSVEARTHTLHVTDWVLCWLLLPILMSHTLHVTDLVLCWLLLPILIHACN